VGTKKCPLYNKRGGRKICTFILEWALPRRDASMAKFLAVYRQVAKFAIPYFLSLGFLKELFVDGFQLLKGIFRR